MRLMQSQPSSTAHVIARLFQVLLYALASLGALFSLGWSVLGGLVWINRSFVGLGLSVIGLALSYTLSFTAATGGLGALIGVVLSIDDRLTGAASPPMPQAPAWSPAPGGPVAGVQTSFATIPPGW